MASATTDGILVDNGNKFILKADYYMSRGELEGSLINYLLAGNCFHTLIESNSAGDNKDFQTKLTKCMKYIIPLQEKLQQIKRDRGCKKDEEKDKISCTDVKTTKNDLKKCFTFDKVSGQKEAKNQIKNGIIMPILYPRLYPHSSKGILFYGPPGTGKTLLATSFVNELQIQADCHDMPTKIILYSPTGAELKGKYVGETEKNIRKYFDCAEKQANDCMYSQLDLTEDDIKDIGVKKDGLDTDGQAKITRVISVIFIDEVDAIAGDRSKDNSGLMSNSVNTLLQMMDGVNKYENIVVMAATNYPWSLDDAVMRRFDTKVFVSLPDVDDTIDLIKLECMDYITKALGNIKSANFAQASKEINLKLCDEQQNSKDEIAVKDFSINDGNNHTCTLSDIIERKYNLCVSNCYATSTTMTNKFNFFRNEYFPFFFFFEITKLANLYVQSNYAGGDIKNACRYVFKKMGNMAIETKRFKRHEIYNPTKQELYEDNFEAKSTPDKNTFKIQDKEKPNEKKKFLLYSSSAGPISGANRKGTAELYINLTEQDINKEEDYDMFGYIIPKKLSEIIINSQNLLPYSSTWIPWGLSQVIIMIQISICIWRWMNL